MFYVGGYAEPGQRGILKCALDGGHVSVLDFNDELHNPSWVLSHPNRPLLYAVEELSPEGGLAALAETDGHLRVVARVSTRGADPCHISMSPDMRHLLAANYSGGSLAVFALDAGGLPVGMTDFWRHSLDDGRRGKGNPVRQEAPHIHFSLCDGKDVYVNDLGMDRVFIYGWDAEGGQLIDRGRALEFPDGSGPRHLAFGPDGRYLYVLCELNATVHVFQRQDGDWRRIQVVSTVPEDFGGFERYTWSVGAAIRFADARTLCASTRGHDSVAVFRVDEEGLLADRRILPSGGRTPRDFLPVEGGLLIANQDSGGLWMARGANGEYAAAERCLEAIRPTCLCMALR